MVHIVNCVNYLYRFRLHIICVLFIRAVAIVPKEKVTIRLGHIAKDGREIVAKVAVAHLAGISCAKVAMRSKHFSNESFCLLTIVQRQ